MSKYFSENQNKPSGSKYNVHDFIFRFKKLEKIATKEGVDGILIVNGIDSRNNDEYIKLTNWLFFGIYNNIKKYNNIYKYIY